MVGDSAGMPKLSADEERRWQAAFDDATKLESSDLQQAIKLYRQAETIDAEHALLLFRLGRCLDRLGRSHDAKEYYLRAKDQDVCPLRMLEEMSGILKDVAHETDREA